MQQRGHNTGTQQRGDTTVTATQAVSATATTVREAVSATATEAQPRGNKQAVEQALPTPIPQHPIANTGGGGGGGGVPWSSSKPPPSGSFKPAAVLAAPAAASFEAKARALFEAKAEARAHAKNSSSAKWGYDISPIDASTGTGYRGRHSGELIGVGVGVQEHKGYSGESLTTGGMRL